jgi:hypothetical protein
MSAKPPSRIAGVAGIRGGLTPSCQCALLLQKRERNGRSMLESGTRGEDRQSRDDTARQQLGPCGLSGLPDEAEMTTQELENIGSPPCLTVAAKSARIFIIIAERNLGVFALHSARRRDLYHRGLGCCDVS